MKYRHTLQVELVTQFPNAPDPFANQIQQMLGPWCEKVTVIKMNEHIITAPAPKEDDHE